MNVRIPILIGAVLMINTQRSRADNYPRNWDLDILEYRFTLSLSDTSKAIYGATSITARFLSNQNHFSLDLISKNDTGEGMEITEITSGDKALKFDHSSDRLVIYAESEFAQGDTIEFKILYEGIPRDGLIISDNKFGDRTYFGDNWPDRARHWLPTVDHPSDKAHVEFTIICPEKYKVVANGRLVYEFVDENWGQRFTYWSESVEISTKLMVIGVAPFAVKELGRLGDVPVEAWVFPQNSEAGFHDYFPAVEILSYFDSLVGPYPYEKLANVQSKTRYGGMENASNIFYFENSVTGAGNVDELIAHEIAHQWFGNSVTEKDWHHVWLSEGFATYFTRIYIERFKGVDAMKGKLEEDRKRTLDFYHSNPSPIVNTSIVDFNNLLNANSYQKGGWVLHMLRNKVGDKHFFSGIRSYYDQFRDGNALTSDFIDVMEKASGQDLKIFFEQWVYDSSIPTLDFDWSYNSKSKEVTMNVSQIQDSPMVFDLEIQVDDRLIVVPISKQKEQLTVEVSSKPGRVEIDPNTRLLFATGK